MHEKVSIMPVSVHIERPLFPCGNCNWHHLANLWMPNSGPANTFFYVHITPMKDSYHYRFCCVFIIYVKCSKILKTLLFFFSNKMVITGLELTKCSSE